MGFVGNGSEVRDFTQHDIREIQFPLKIILIEEREFFLLGYFSNKCILHNTHKYDLQALLCSM
jgi:hypothetical protein